MGRALLWFGVFYGDITAAIILIVAGGYWAETEQGGRLCSTVSLDPQGCKGVIALVVLICTGLAAIFSYRRMTEAKKQLESGKNSAEGQEEVSDTRKEEIEK